jgi:hypothetical protein
MNKIFNLFTENVNNETLTSKSRDIKPISLKTKKSDSGKEIYLASFSKE